MLALGGKRILPSLLFCLVFDLLSHLLAGIIQEKSCEAEEYRGKLSGKNETEQG
mgnify:FL=1